MKYYSIRLSAEVEQDIDDIFQYIAYKLMVAETALRYKDGIIHTIDKLKVIGGSLAINQRDYVQDRWGPEARTISYKNVIIIYNIIDDTVLVRRVIADKMIQ